MRSFISFANRGRTHWVYYVTTVALVGLGYVAGQTPLLSILSVLYVDGQAAIETFEKTRDFQSIDFDPVIGVYLIMLTYVGALIALWIGIRWIHRRPFWTLIGKDEHNSMLKVLWACAIWFGLSILIEAIFYSLDPGNYRYTGMQGRWLSMMGLAVFFIPLQAAFEELFFRGYLLQGIGHAFQSPWLASILTSLLFAAMHGFNPEIDLFGFWPMMGYYFLAGLFLAVVTIYSNSLSLAIGIHAATNIFSGLIAGYEGSVFKLPALYKVIEVQVGWMTLVLFVMGVGFILLARNKFHWGLVLSSD